MSPLDRGDFLKALTHAYSIYDKPLTSELSELWFNALRQYPLGAIRVALEQHVQYGKFTPRPADIVRRIAGTDANGDAKQSTPDDPQRSRHCSAPGCPNPSQTFFPALCKFHAYKPQEQWQEITDGINNGERQYEYPLTAAQKNQLGYLVESGKYDELPTIAGDQGVRWARQEVRERRLRPNSWKPTPADYAATDQFLTAVANDTGYGGARETELHDDGSLSP